MTEHGSLDCLGNKARQDNLIQLEKEYHLANKLFRFLTDQKRQDSFVQKQSALVQRRKNKRQNQAQKQE